MHAITRTLITGLLLGTASTMAVAQGTEPRGTSAQAAGPQAGGGVPQSNPEALVKRTGPRVGQAHFMKKYGISAADALERVELEAEVNKLAAELGSGTDEGFGGIWIEHEPVYRIVVAFTDNKDRTALRERVSPKMRRHLQIKNVAKNQRQLEADIDAVILSLAASKIEYVSFYDQKGDTLVVEVADEGQVGVVRNLVPPRLRSEIKVRKGVLPEKLQIANVQPGDEVYGGWWHHTSEGASLHNCTFGFTAKNNLGRPVVLTAAHCDGSTWVQQAGHWINLGSHVAEWPTGKYDYQFQNANGLKTGPFVWYENNKITHPAQYSARDNYVPGYNPSGYFRVTGSRGYADQKVGQYLCKSGRSTGLTCGEILHGYYTWNGTKGWIQSGYSFQELYAFKGDSGGPVFSDDLAGPIGDILALGILVGGNTFANPDGSRRPCLPEDNTTCYAVHMPIDYIDDQQLLTLDIATR